MADNRTSTDCPVAALADEAQRLIKAHGAVDAAGATEASKVHWNAVADTTIEALHAVLQRASWLEARSARGALFQISAIADMVGMITGNPMHSRNSCMAEKAISRLLYSVASFIERTNSEGVKLEDCCGDYYLDRRFSAHEYLVEAFQMAELRAKEAA